MSEVGYVRPGGDSSAADLADWAARLRALLEQVGHRTLVDVSVQTPCDRPTCEAALASPVSTLFFFGHGDEDALLRTAQEPIIDDSNVSMGCGKALVSVACEAGLQFGPKAVQGGVRAHLGWNVLLLWLASARLDYGEAIVHPLSLFGRGSSVSEVADELKRSLNEIARRYRTTWSHDPNAKIAYYAAAAAAGQVAVDGDRRMRPLSRGVVSTAVGWVRWRGIALARSTRKALQGDRRD